MNTKLLFTTLVILMLHVSATGQNWQWADNISGGLDDRMESIATDASGNIYVAGWFRSGQLSVDTITLNNAFGGTGDVFVAKFNSLGNVIWAKNFGGVNDDKSMSIAVNPAGDAYVVGYFLSPSILFGNDTVFNSSISKNDFFIMKFDSQGNPQWARNAQGTDHDYGSAVAIAPDGSVSVTGTYYSASITFDTMMLSNVNTSFKDIFVVKYDAQGNVKWAKSGMGNSADMGNGISSDLNGNVYVTGSFSSSPLTFDTISLANTGFQNVFVVKYDSLGNIIWAVNPTGNNTDEGFAITTDNNDDVFVTGSYKSTNFSIGTFNLSNSGQQDIFVAKYSPSGVALWAKKASGNSYDEGYSITTDNFGNCYVTGYFFSPAVYFDATTFLTNTFSGWGDLFVAKYDPLGNLSWAVGTGGNDTDFGTDVVINNNNVNICGAYDSPSIPFGTTTLNAINGYIEGFIASMGISTSIFENDPEKEIFYVSIYPNPFSTQTTLQTDKVLKNASLTVYNSFGQTVKQLDNLAGQTIVFHRDNLPSGLYFVRITQDGKTFSVDKFVITDK